MSALRAALLLALVAMPTMAQQPAAIHTIQLTDEQIDSIIAGGAQCLDKQPYACAAYAIFVRNILLEARKPKPPPATAPDPPK